MPIVTHRNYVFKPHIITAGRHFVFVWKEMLHNKELNRNPCHKHKLFLLYFIYTYDTNCITFLLFYRAMFLFPPGVNWIVYLYIHTKLLYPQIISFLLMMTAFFLFIYHRVSSSSHFSRHIVNVYSFINVLFMMGTKKIFNI